MADDNRPLKLANNRVFVSKLVKALRDQIVFQTYYSDQLLPTAEEMCVKLAQELNAECSSHKQENQQ